MDRYNQLFDIDRYSDDAEICFSINGDAEGNAFYLSESICSRIICIGEAYRLHYVPLIDIYGDIKLNKLQVHSLIDELSFIKSVVNDTIIHHVVPTLIELIEKITRSQNESTLWIMGN